MDRPGAMAKVTFHGHATCSLETDDGTHLVIDQSFADNPTADVSVCAAAARTRVAPGSVRAETLPGEFSVENRSDGSSSHKPAPALGWRHVPYDVYSGSRNMALDHALAESVGASGAEGVVRLYGWTRPTLSLGRNEPAAAYPIDVLRASGYDVVRRPTGGRAVLHDRELTYAVVAPLRAWDGVREAYVRINEALADALRTLGAPVHLTRDARTLGPDAGPCFQAPAAGEVVARGRKLVGSAQVRMGGALLQHGSILLAGDQGPLAGTTGEVEASRTPITLSELVGDVTIDEVAGVVAESLRAAFRGVWAEGGISPSEQAAADRLEANRYAQDSWTWRR